MNVFLGDVANSSNDIKKHQHHHSTPGILRCLQSCPPPSIATSAELGFVEEKGNGNIEGEWGMGDGGLVLTVRC
jgi:hypothetical protein